MAASTPEGCSLPVVSGATFLLLYILLFHGYRYNVAINTHTDIATLHPWNIRFDDILLVRLQSTQLLNVSERTRIGIAFYSKCGTEYILLWGHATQSLLSWYYENQVRICAVFVMHAPSNFQSGKE
jgi:hypothetical protein